MAALVSEYRGSPAYVGCKPSTRRSYDQALSFVETKWGDLPVREWTRGAVNDAMARLAGEPKRANRLHKRLRALFELAVDLGWIAVNPAGKQRPYRVAANGFPEWPEHEIERFHVYWPRGTKQRVAFDLLLFLGQRSIDTVAMARNHIEGEHIRVVQEKTGTELWIRVHSDLRATLEVGPVGGLYLMETQNGAPRTVKGFYNWMKKAASAAGCDPRLSPHGLRKSAATRLIDAGCTSAQVCAITGHSSIQEMERYVQARNRRKLGDAAILKLEKRNG